MKTKYLLGVKIDDLNLVEGLEIVAKWAKEDKKRYIVTPNPEFLVAAQGDQKFKEVLNDSDLAIPDGVGLKITGDIVCHIPGVDFMEGIIKRSPDWGATVGFLGGKDLVAKKAADCLKKKYPKIKISFVSEGGVVNKDGDFVSPDPKFQIPKTDILFVGFGQVKQEKWISKNLKIFPVKIMMGVGGSFDYLSGEVLRAPKFFRDLGLEWLFRLIAQPWRITRQLSLLKFIWLVCKEKITH